ncbi:MAG: DUF4912 domain-containing protein, partial [Chromatiales bacterium]|nr:DUF4912 domain-containing protein [Chromatiales bacterium]
MNIEKLSTLSDEALLTLADRAGTDRARGPGSFLPGRGPPGSLGGGLGGAGGSPGLLRTPGGDGVQGHRYPDILETSLDSGWCSDSRYNETMIRLLVRDTAWAFAFWDVNDE